MGLGSRRLDPFCFEQVAQLGDPLAEAVDRAGQVHGIGLVQSGQAFVGLVQRGGRIRELLGSIEVARSFDRRFGRPDLHAGLSMGAASSGSTASRHNTAAAAGRTSRGMRTQRDIAVSLAVELRPGEDR